MIFNILINLENTIIKSALHKLKKKKKKPINSFLLRIPETKTIEAAVLIGPHDVSDFHLFLIVILRLGKKENRSCTEYSKGCQTQKIWSVHNDKRSEDSPPSI